MKQWYLLFICSIVILGTGCAREYVEDPVVQEFMNKDPDSGGAVKAVRGYNKALIATYTANEINFLKEYATDRELYKVRHLIDGFVAQGLRMEAELKRMRVEKIERWGQQNVIVTTREMWKYRRYYPSTGKEEKPMTQIEYHVTYNMTREDGRTWKVFNLTPL